MSSHPNAPDDSSRLSSDFRRPFNGEQGQRVALVFALTAEQLNAFYEHGRWLTVGEGSQLIQSWLQRRQGSMASQERQQLSLLSNNLARDIAAGLSREAGLFTAHTMMEALDPNQISPTAATMLEECERRLLEMG